MNQNQINLTTAVEILKTYSALNNAWLLDLIQQASDFRTPSKGDLYFSNTDGQVTIATMDEYQEPRLIKDTETLINTGLNYAISVEEVYKNPVRIPKGYRFLSFRPVQKNDLFIMPAGGFVQTALLPGSGIMRIIVAKE